MLQPPRISDKGYVCACVCVNERVRARVRVGERLRGCEVERLRG